MYNTRMKRSKTITFNVSVSDCNIWMAISIHSFDVWLSFSQIGLRMLFAAISVFCGFSNLCFGFACSASILFLVLSRTSLSYFSLACCNVSFNLGMLENDVHAFAV
jgi:hypothetical protein